MDFALLGPLEVRRGGRLLDLGAPRERAVLAILLLEPGVMVSVDRLVDRLWGEEPPSTARHAVHVSISRLRGLLETMTESRLSTRRPGYQVRVEPAELDVDRFRLVCAQGRAAVAEGDLPVARRLLTEALAQWRGPALADLQDYDWARAAATELDNARWAALESLGDVRLEMGEAAELVPGLEALVRSAPGRENLWAQLMLALYRSGRQSDALGAYRSVHDYLVDELGVEPCPELRRLHAAILQHSSTVSRPDRVEEPPAPEAADHDLVERRVVSVMVTALRTTGAAGWDDPETAAADVAAFHRHVAEHVRATGGIVEECSPSGARATFGTSGPDDHADRALTAAMLVRDKLRSGIGPQTQVQIGVATGEVVQRTSRTSGWDRPPSISTHGLVVVQATQLAGLAGPGRIVVSPYTCSAARAGYRWGDDVSVPSWQRPGREVRAHSPAPVADDGLGLHRSFVAREADIGRLLAAYDGCVRDAAPRLVTILGEPGVGKSALLRRFHDVLRQDRTPQVYAGQCLSYGRGVTYRAVGDVLRQYLGVGEAEPVRPALERLGAVGADLAFTFDAPSSSDVHPAAIRQRLHDAWVAAVERASADAPVVLLVEDVHWAEGPLVDLLGHLVGHVDGPLLVVLTARPDYDDHLSRPTRRTTVSWLEPFTPAETTRMLRALLQADPPDALCRAIVDRSEGYPFFVEELLAALVEEGRLARTADVWELRGGALDPAVPHTIRAVIAARIDLLSPPQKSVLQAASVIGRVFSASMACALAGTVADLPDLVERRLLHNRPALGPGAGFEFTHALTRDVAYASLPRGARAHLHAELAGRLEADSPSGDDAVAIIAYHYARSVRPEDVDLAWADRPGELERLRDSALRWSVRAGNLAVARFAIDEGIALLQQALTLSPDRRTEADIWRAIGHAHALRYEGPECQAALQRAIDLSDDPRERADSYAELAMQFSSRYAMMNLPGPEVVTSWIDTALAGTDPDGPAHARALTAYATWAPDDPLSAAERAVQAADRLGDPLLQSLAYYARSAAAYLAGDHSEADRWAQRRLALVDLISDPDQVVDIYGSMVPSLLGRGNFARALEYVQLHDRYASRLTPHHQLHAVAMYLELYEVIGDWESVRDLTDRTVEAVRANTVTPCQRNTRAPLVCAYAWHLAGDVERAGELQALAEAEELPSFQVFGQPLKARLALARGDLDGVRRLLPMRRQHPAWKHWYQLVATTIGLDVMLALGDRDAVERDAVPLLVPGTYLEPFAQRALGLVREDQGLVDEATEGFLRMGLSWYAEVCASGVPSGRAR